MVFCSSLGMQVCLSALLQTHDLSMFNCKPTLIPLRNLHQISMTLDAITKYVNICKYINLANTQDIHSYSVSQKNRIDPTNKRLINREDNSDTVK